MDIGIHCVTGTKVEAVRSGMTDTGPYFSRRLRVQHEGRETVLILFGDREEDLNVTLHVEETPYVEEAIA